MSYSQGNVTLINKCTNKESQGAVGRTGTVYKKFLGIKLVKFDVVKAQPVRDDQGFCIECQFDEPGELIAPIMETDPLRRFSGYYGDQVTSITMMKK